MSESLPQRRDVHRRVAQPIEGGSGNHGTGSGGGGATGPCNGCGGHTEASLVTLSSGAEVAEIYTTTDFNSLFGITELDIAHVADDDFASDDIGFTCDEEEPE
jgi:hypothetical protein